MNSVTIPLLNIDFGSYLNGKACAFLCCASFETRAVIIPQHIPVKLIKKPVIFCMDGISIIDISVNEINRSFADNAMIIRISRTDPFLTANQYIKLLESLVEEKIDTLCIDISTFTHESLLILLRVLSMNANKFKKIVCTYIGASEYSIGDLPEEKWLTKGCKNIRNVIGFPGKLIPGKPTCLIVLVGFEHERAMCMISEMEPDRILLGTGIPEHEHVISDSHLAPMAHFNKMFDTLLATHNDVHRFEFSSRSIQTTLSKLEESLKYFQNYNGILVPLNTKVSTIAAGLFALRRPEIQICYAEPEIYNIEHYSAPDSNVTIFELDFNLE